MAWLGRSGVTLILMDILSIIQDNETFCYSRMFIYVVHILTRTNILR